VASADSTDVESVSAGAVDNDGQMSPAARSRGGENIACPHVEAALLRGMATRPSCRRVAWWTPRATPPPLQWTRRAST